MKKECKKHGITDYNSHNKCKKCNVENVQRRRWKVKEMAVKYKGGKCERCGYDKCIDALEFHHRDSSKKDFGIGSKGYTRSWDKVKEELDKCDMLCSNCHKEVHYEIARKH